jgi:hypothetical protein
MPHIVTQTLAPVGPIPTLLNKRNFLLICMKQTPPLLTLFITNSNPLTTSRSIGSYKTTAIGLGQALIGLASAGHIVTSIDFDGAKAYIIVFARVDGWMDSVNLAVRGSTVTARERRRV